VAKKYQLFKFYVSRDTQPHLAQLLEGMPSHQRNAFIRDAIEQYGKRRTSPEGDVVALAGIMGEHSAI
jgi:DNA-directed RNA polymerase specialized sigma24 family protein